MSRQIFVGFIHHDILYGTRIIRQDISATWEKLIKSTYRAHLFHQLKCNLLGEKDGLYMLVLLASPRWLWCPGEYLLVSYSMIFCMEPEYIRQDISATWEKLIKPTYRVHLFHPVSCTLSVSG